MLPEQPLSSLELLRSSRELHSVIIILTKSNAARKSHFSGMTLGSHTTVPSCEPGAQGEEKPGQKVSYTFYDPQALSFAGESREKSS